MLPSTQRTRPSAQTPGWPVAQAMLPPPDQGRRSRSSRPSCSWSRSRAGARRSSPHASLCIWPGEHWHGRPVPHHVAAVEITGRVRVGTEAGGAAGAAVLLGHGDGPAADRDDQATCPERRRRSRRGDAAHHGASTTSKLGSTWAGGPGVGVTPVDQAHVPVAVDGLPRPPGAVAAVVAARIDVALAALVLVNLVAAGVDRVRRGPEQGGGAGRPRRQWRVRRIRSIERRSRRHPHLELLDHLVEEAARAWRSPS